METSTSNYEVSIIIVTCNSMPAIDDSLASLKSVVAESDCELIVIDNASTDGSVECVKRHFPKATIIEPGRNLGFAAACNYGARAAKGEYLLFHNPDLQIDRGTIDRLLEVYGAEEKVGVVAGRMRFPDGSFQANCRNFPTIGNLIFSRGSAISRFVGRAGTYTLPDYNDMTEIPAVAGTLMMISKKLFVRQEGFDERYFMYMEDTDICLRLHRSGYRNFFVPRAGGVHLWGKGSRGGKVKRLYYHHISVWKYFVKHFPNPVSFLILPVILIVNFILAAIVPERPERG